MYTSGWPQEMRERGISVLMIDNPGSGEALRFQDLKSRIESEQWATAQVDWLESRDDVDSDRIGLVGWSLGGYYCPRAAAFEKRFKLVAVWGANHNWGEVQKKRLQREGENPVPHYWEHVLWVWGFDDVDAFIEYAEGVNLDGVVEKIEVPFLIAHGENDRQISVDYAHQSYDQAVNSPQRELRIFTVEEGAAEHVGLDHMPHINAFVADWVEDTLRRPMTVEEAGPAWVARMITPVADLDAAPVFRRVVELSGDVRRATLAVTALGVVEASVNGVPVSDEVLAPGWTSYEWRLRVRRHDVTHLVRDTAEIRLLVGNGWHRGRLGFHGNRQLYGERAGAFAQLEVEHADGRTEVVGTDTSWEVGASAILADDLYDGQTIDARRREPACWGQVRELQLDTALLDDADHPAIRRHESIRAQHAWTAPSGETLLDFGQNLVGWLRLTVAGRAGDTVVVRHAEVLEDGELCVRPLRTAQATDRFVLSGGVDVFEPTFTTHGFRYAGITGWPGELTVDDVEAVVVHTEQERTGHFSCSDERLERLHRNAVWTWRGNSVGVPTDCPQRDERLGWTGDLTVFAPSAAFLFDVRPFLTQWLVDVALEQAHADGRVPLVAPDCLKLEPPPEGLPPMDASAIWADAAVWVPWTLWEAYGDDAVLRDQWPSMLSHVERVPDRLLSERGLWEGGFQFGDWLDPTAPADQPGLSRADTGVVATAVFHRSVVLAARTAAVLGLPDEERALRALADDVRAAFLEHYVDAEGRVHSDCPTAYALALQLGLLDDDPRRRRAGDRLAELVRAEGHHIGTGFAGTAFVLDALADTGYLDDAYALLLQTSCPSWLYPVTMGATTVWERWDSMLPDGSVNPGSMTSFNHYALGSVADFLHRVVGGLSPVEPGYRRFRVAPRPGGGLTYAAARLETSYGRVGVSWTATDGDLASVTVEVPDGCTAEVDLGEGRTTELGVGVHTLEP